ncbi:hypothetical protein RRG08_064687 [Elysia crispata]|uniref:Uncharacterized protein n=1 Tax=Elysia crispata TaxID=231223 RepID=A0AAE0YI02_9GAST|nr:hypothetical protein RRG08_064687 [Elysia crispata]
MKSLFFICLALAVLLGATTAYRSCLSGGQCSGKSYKLYTSNGFQCCAHTEMFPIDRRGGCTCVSKGVWCYHNGLRCGAP